MAIFLAGPGGDIVSRCPRNEPMSPPPGSGDVLRRTGLTIGSSASALGSRAAIGKGVTGCTSHSCGEGCWLKARGTAKGTPFSKELRPVEKTTASPLRHALPSLCSHGTWLNNSSNAGPPQGGMRVVEQCSLLGSSVV